MAEFVNECPDTVGTAVFPFVGAGVPVEFHSVQSQLPVGCGNLPGVRPYTFGGPPDASLSGIEDENIVDISVSVAVILREVDGAVESLASLDDHHFRIAVVARPVVAAIVRPFGLESHRSVYVEYRRNRPPEHSRKYSAAHPVAS